MLKDENHETECGNLESFKINEGNCTSNNSSNNTSIDIDSPLGGSGSATHHVFHHIFRQYELDELINRHVSNLHIVSSYYDSKSWFVICEKVQVWTI